MSFSKEVKEELSFVPDTARHCSIAELASIAEICGKLVKTKNKQPKFLLQTENRIVAERFFLLLQDVFSIKSEVSVRKNKTFLFYTLLVEEFKKVTRICQALKLEQKQIEQENILFANNLIVQNTCCKRAFIRGAFLAAGSVTNPEKTYHFEVAYNNELSAKQLKECIHSFAIDAKIIKRKRYFVVYVKEGSQIVDLLNIMEAYKALMELENIRILKEVRNCVNRQVNCETANISKTVIASSRQVEDINYIKNTIGFERLTEGLEEIAVLRINYPDATLKELGEMLCPKVGKSGIYHRLKKICNIAEELRKKEEIRNVD